MNIKKQIKSIENKLKQKESKPYFKMLFRCDKYIYIDTNIKSKWYI